MKIKKTAALAAAVLLLLTAFTGCKSDEDSKSYSSDKKSNSEQQVSIAESPDELPASGAMPVMSISSTEGKPGETVTVSVSLSGAEEKWSVCGIHFSYPQELKCVTIPDDATKPEFAMGDALHDSLGFVAAIWNENLSDELIQNNMYSVFFTAPFSGDGGHDGLIAEFQFTIPEDAAVGTVYNLDFFWREGDCFLDAAQDEKLAAYLQNHWQGGTITVV